MKNPDSNDEMRRRREAGSDQGNLDGKAAAEKLFGGLPDEDQLPDLSGLTDEQLCELVEQEILDRHEGTSSSETRRFAAQFRSQLNNLLNL
jgi:hypothetical protein